MKNEYGIQLYSVRDAMGENMEKAMAKVVYFQCCCFKPVCSAA